MKLFLQPKSKDVPTDVTTVEPREPTAQPEGRMEGDVESAHALQPTKLGFTFKKRGAATKQPETSAPSVEGAKPSRFGFGLRKKGGQSEAGEPDVHAGVSDPSADAPASRSRFAFGRKKPAQAVAADAKPVKQGEEHAPAETVKAVDSTRRKLKIPKFNVLPIRVIVGYLPEVTERDAREYALGIAEKHFEQIGMVFFDAYEYDGGYAYEVHEGGEGKAYLPSILNYFRSQGPYQTDEHVFSVIETATRKVEVVRLRQGLAALILPESSDAVPTEWLMATKKMTPAINRQRALLLAGIACMASGFVAMMVTGLFFRIQGYLPAEKPKVETISAATLPRSQWRHIQALGPDAYIKAIRFRNGAWEKIEVYSEEAPAAAPAAPPAAPGATALPPVYTPALIQSRPTPAGNKP